MVAFALLATACASGPDTAVPAGVDQGTGEAVVYVALGGGGSTGDDLKGSWSQLLFRSSLPRRTIHVNLAGRGSTVCCGLADQVARAIELKVTLATVWFGDEDAELATPADRFAEDLEAGIARLRAAGTRVLVIAAPARGAGGVGPYEQEITEVATRTGSDLVDLTEVDVTGTAAQQGIADAIAEVLGPVR